MNRCIHSILFLFVLVILAIWNPSSTQAAVMITPSQPQTLTVNSTLSLSANAVVTWHTSNNSVASVDPVSGMVTAQSPGTAVITASTNSGDYGYITVTVNPVPVPLRQIDLSPSPVTLVFGEGEFQLNPIFTPNNATNQTITWTSTNPLVAAVDRTLGKIIPASFPPTNTTGPWKTTIIATAADGGYTAFSEVEVVRVSSIALNQNTVTMITGSEQTLTATVLPSSYAHKPRWTSSNPAVVDVSAQTGLIKAVRPGTATVTATQDGKSATCDVIVQPTVPTSPISIITTRKSSSSVELTWSGTTGNILVELLQGTTVVRSDWSNTNKITFTGLSVDTEYKIRMNSLDNKTFMIKKLTGTTNVTNFKVEHVSATDVDLTWGGTTEEALVEIKMYGSDRIADHLKTSNRSASFVGLVPDSSYNVWIDGLQAGTFKTEKSVKTFKVESKTSSTVTLSWDGSVDKARIVLKKLGSESTVEEEYTKSKIVNFDSLRPDTVYKVYIEDVYVGTFKTDPGPLVKNFKVTRKSSSSVDITWTDDLDDEVEVILRKSGSDSIVDEEETSKKKVTFTGLSSSKDYKVYIDDVYMDTFQIDKLQTIQHFTVIPNNQQLSVQLSWTGTDGSVEVTLKNGQTTFATKATSTRQTSFSGLIPDQEYGVYISGQFVGNVKLGFPDITSHWAKTAINRLFQLKIVNGYEDGKFKPEATVNREEFTTMLVRVKGYTLVRGQQTFTDVDRFYWANSYIQTAISKGIILPNEYGSAFHPLNPITREEMAVMLARALGLSSSTDTIAFKDDGQIKNKGLVGAITKAGIIKGYPDQTFGPTHSLTRAEAAEVINQIYKP